MKLLSRVVHEAVRVTEENLAEVVGWGLRAEGGSGKVYLVDDHDRVETVPCWVVMEAEQGPCVYNDRNLALAYALLLEDEDKAMIVQSF